MTSNQEVACELPEWWIDGALRDEQSVDPTWKPVALRLIDGVHQHEVRPVMTRYGRLVELHRPEWATGGAPVAQVFTSILREGSVSAWHVHGRSTDRISLVSGTVRLVLYDARIGSATYGLINQFTLSEFRPSTVCIPPGVWHGLQNIADGDAAVINAVDQPYDYASPDHYRLPADTPRIPFQFPPRV